MQEYSEYFEEDDRRIARCSRNIGHIWSPRAAPSLEAGTDRSDRVRSRLDELLAEVGPSLVAESARERLAETIAFLGGTAAEIALECHFASRGARVDLVARVHPSDRDRLLARGGLPEALRCFLCAWATPGDALERLPFVELEFDLEASIAHWSTPWIGPANEPLVRRGVSAIAASKRGKAVEAWPSYELAIAIMAALGIESSAWRERIHQCFGALPAYGCINHFTVLDARPGASGTGVRMIASLPRFELARFLGAIDFRGSIDRLEEVVDRYLPHRGRVDLDLDVRLDGASKRTAIYGEFVAPRVRNSVLQDLCRALEEDGVDSAVVADLRAWIAHVDGDLSRILSVKVGIDGEGSFVKGYLQSRGV